MNVPATVTWGSLPAGAVAFMTDGFYIKADDSNGTNLADGVINSNFNPTMVGQSFPNASLNLG